MTQDVSHPGKGDRPLHILFCANWPIDRLAAPTPERFSPDYYIPGQPYWFFKHLNDNFRLDVLDCRSPLNLHHLQKKLARCYISQGIAAWLQARHYDVVISHGGQTGLPIGLLQSLTGQAHPPHVLFDVGAITGGRAGITNPLIVHASRVAVRSMAAVICHSSHQLQFYRDYFPTLTPRAHFIPLGVDTGDFAPRDAPAEDRILCVGYSMRDWRLLVKAYAGLRTTTTLVLLGIPPNEAPQCPGVVSVPKVNIEQMRQWIAGSRAVVLPLPPVDYCIGQQTMLQAMAMGKAVLTSDICAVRDYITPGEDAIWYRAGDVDDLRANLTTLLATSGLADRLGRAARRTVERKFSEATMAGRIAEVLSEVVQ